MDMNEAETNMMYDAEALNELSNYCYQSARKGGWYTDLETGLDKDRNVPEMMMLMVSEIAEAMEAYRKNLMDDKIPSRKGVEVELVDLLIRTFDLAGYLRLDLMGAFIDKMQYNMKREDHKIENRRKANGKSF